LGGWEFIGLVQVRDLSFNGGKQLAPAGQIEASSITIKSDQVLVTFNALLLLSFWNCKLYSSSLVVAPIFPALPNILATMDQYNLATRAATTVQKVQDCKTNSICGRFGTWSQEN
jgi:hypothetical protein